MKISNQTNFYNDEQHVNIPRCRENKYIHRMVMNLVTGIKQ